MPVLLRVFFIEITFADIIDIGIMAAGIYTLLSLMQGTRARAMLLGMVLLIIGAVIAYWLDLITVSWVIQRLGTVWALGFLIVFQPELRDILTRLGNSGIFRAFSREDSSAVIDDLITATRLLADSKIGALIAVQRQVPLDVFVSTGKPIGAVLTPELLGTIFAPHTPLHDGGVVVVGNKIVCAAAEFPLTENQRYRRTLGMRHRAAVGISEQTDAATIVVSEETGGISLAVRGYLRRNLSPEALKRLLEVILSDSKTADTNIHPQ